MTAIIDTPIDLDQAPADPDEMPALDGDELRCEGECFVTAAAIPGLPFAFVIATRCEAMATWSATWSCGAEDCTRHTMLLCERHAEGLRSAGQEDEHGRIVLTMLGEVRVVELRPL